MEWWLANAIDTHLQLIIVSGGSWVWPLWRGIPADGEHARRIELRMGAGSVETENTLLNRIKGVETENMLLNRNKGVISHARFC